MNTDGQESVPERQIESSSLEVDLDLRPPENSDTEAEQSADSWPEASDVEKQWTSEPEAKTEGESDSDTLADESYDDLDELDDDELAGRGEFSDEKFFERFQIENTGGEIKLLTLDELRRYEEGLGPEEKSGKYAHFIVEEHLSQEVRTECQRRLELGCAYKQIRELGAANKKLLDLAKQHQKKEQEMHDKLTKKLERSERQRMKQKNQAEEEIARLQLLILNRKERIKKAVAERIAKGSRPETEAEKAARLAQFVSDSNENEDEEEDEEEESEPKIGPEEEMNDSELEVQDSDDDEDDEDVESESEDEEFKNDEDEDVQPLQPCLVEEQNMSLAGEDEENDEGTGGEEIAPENEEKIEEGDGSSDMNVNKEELPLPSKFKEEFTGVFDDHEHDLIKSMLQKNDDKGVIIISDDDEDLPGPAPAPVEMTDSIVISDEDSDEPRERTESYVPVTGFNKYELGLMNHAGRSPHEDRKKRSIPRLNYKE